MTRYVANTAEILAFADKARTIEQHFEQRLAALEREIEGLHIDWSGDAAEAHRANHDTWQREMADMRTALTALETAARDAQQRYVRNVEHNQRMWPA